MTIETKYNMYDDIFFLSNKKACQSKIRGMKITVNSSPIEIINDIVYLCNTDSDSNVFIKVSEQDAFKTKEELLKSL